MQLGLIPPLPFPLAYLFYLVPRQRSDLCTVLRVDRWPSSHLVSSGAGSVSRVAALIAAPGMLGQLEQQLAAGQLPGPAQPVLHLHLHTTYSSFKLKNFTYRKNMVDRTYIKTKDKSTGYCQAAIRSLYGAAGGSLALEILNAHLSGKSKLG